MHVFVCHRSYGKETLLSLCSIPPITPNPTPGFMGGLLDHWQSAGLSRVPVSCSHGKRGKNPVFRSQYITPLSRFFQSASLAPVNYSERSATTCKIQLSSSTSKTKLSFNLLPKRVSRSHKNNPWSSIPKYHSFTAYCVYNTHFYLVRTRIHLFVRMKFSSVVSLDRARPCACPYLPTEFCTFDPKSSWYSFGPLNLVSLH